MGWLINCLIGLFSKKISRRANFNYDDELFRKLIWVCDNRKLSHPDITFKYDDIDENLLIEALTPVIKYIDNRHDCADFRCIQLIKLKYIAKDLFDIYPNIEEKVKKTLLNFKFWLISKGQDAMCYYSENHQIVFIACEYLIGQFYPNDIFKIDGLDGKAHMNMALERFNYWIELRKKYSYAEFYSSNYFPVDLLGLSMLILYSNNDFVILESKKQMDILLQFYASTLFEETFINASGRDYGRNVMDCSYNEPNSMMVIDTVFKDGKKALMRYDSSQYLFASFYLNNDVYHLKDDIKELVKKEEMICERKFGLNLKDYEAEGLLNNTTKALMMRLGSGALTNPEIINLTIKMMHENKNLYASDFLCWVRYFYSPLLYYLGLMPFISKKLHFYNNRMAIQENNVYTYRNKYYRLSCSQNYLPTSFGAQRNTIVATLKKGVTIYTNHPLVKQDRKGYNQNGTPSYFGGYAVAPCACANKNVGLVIYHLPKKKAFLMPYAILPFTHAYFPTELFDEYEVNGRYAFARVEDSYICLIGRNQLYLEKMSSDIFKIMQGKLKDINKSCDLIQEGKDTYWIYELSSGEEESFEAFKKRIKSNKISYEDNVLRYISNEEYKLIYDGQFYINNKEININYEYDLGGEDEKV